jgi:dephospho-CoA kinase
MSASRSSGHPIGAFRVVLAGGVGSGKSTVGRMLADRGAVVIDADAIAREVVEPGTPGLAAVVERFGSGVLQADGSLDRAGLASVVFADADALAALNAITHPLVQARSSELFAAVPPDRICVYEVPLLVEGGPVRTGEFDLVVVVETPMPLRLARLAERGLAPDQARARIAAQASDEQRRAVADEVLTNDGTVTELETKVDGLWARIQAAAVR